MRAVDCDGCPAGVHDVDVVSGAALLVDLRVAEQVGYMDESYFHYKEEVDFCVRVRLTGERVRFCCAYALRHERGGSLSHRSPMAHYYATRNELLFVRRFYGWLELLRMPRLVASLLLAFVPVRGGAHARSVRLGVWHALRGVTGHLATPVWMS